MKLVSARRNEASPNKTSFDKHSLLTERTHRSANAFRFGLRGGSRRHLTAPVASVFRKSAQNFASRSCSTWRWRRRYPDSSSSVADHLGHPLLSRMARDARQAYAASFQMQEEQ